MNKLNKIGDRGHPCLTPRKYNNKNKFNNKN